MARIVNIPATEAIEEFRTINHYIGELVRVMVGKLDSEGNFIVPQAYETFEISGDLYTELMSANPAWAPNKPANTYRQEDLWHFVDLLRVQQ